MRGGHADPLEVSSNTNVLVIVPTFNERENLPLLVPLILEHEGFRVMVVDDRSPDGTGEIADELSRTYPGRVEVVHRTARRGLGRSYVDAYSRAVATDADLVCQMDADLSHDPKYLPDLVAAAEGHDLVIGSRYLHGVSVVNWPLRRIFLSTFANRYIRAVTRFAVHDCTSGFRCWRRSALAQLRLERVVSDGYSFLIEMLYQATRRGFRITEVPIIFVERREGTSKVSMSVLVESLVMPWRVAWRRIFERTPGPADAVERRER